MGMGILIPMGMGVVLGYKLGMEMRIVLMGMEIAYIL